MYCALYSCDEHPGTPASRMHDVGGSRWGDVDRTAVNSKISSNEHLDHDVHVASYSTDPLTCWHVT